MITTPYEQLSDAMRRYYCDAAQKVLKSRRVLVNGRRWFKRFTEHVTPEWYQVGANKSVSRTAELHCKIDLSQLPRGTREVVVVIEGVP